MNEIVVGVDESTGSQMALEWALAEAALRQAPVRLVHVVPAPQIYYPYRLEGLYRDEGGQEAALGAAQKLLKTALAKAGGEPAGVSVEVAPRIGTAADELVAESHDAALVVVGSRGRGGFTGLLLGSVSQQVVQHARCPVVVIPHQR